MILPLRRKGERTQPDYLTEIPVWKVCPSSLGVCSPPLWAVWGESGSSHGGASPSGSPGHGSLNAFQLPPECGIPVLQLTPPPSLTPLLGALDAPALTFGRGGEAEAWFGSSHSPCHAGYEELGQMKAYQPWGAQRWSRLGSRRCHMWSELRLWEGSVPCVPVDIWNCESAAVSCPAPETLSCAMLRLCWEWEVMAFFIRMQCVFLQADLWICKTCTK